MTHAQPKRSLDGCRSPLCGYLEQRESGREHHDRCAHAIPMHSPCAWHRTPEQIKAMHERDAAMLSAARAPMVKRRGL